jgi:hypothetical protein
VTVIAEVDVRRRLSDPELPSRAADLGFRARDIADLLTVVEAVLHSAYAGDDPRTPEADDLATVAQLAAGVLSTIGRIGSEFESRTIDVPSSEVPGAGVLPMLALLVTAPEAAAFHANRRVPEDVSAATLADLGQQVHVHRLTYGEFGLHTHQWVNLVWSGFLFRLGRLQFNLALEQPDGRCEWVLSTHVPADGPLPPTTVDESFATATEFFAAHFPDYPVRWFHCRSWLLDPTLSELLPQSNLAAFQRRWSLYGPPEPGEEDLLFFVFNRREQVEPTSLPTDSALRRVAVDRLVSGRGWSVFNGKLRP